MSAATPATRPAATPAPLAQPATAVTYLRVSTKEQAEKGGSDEGFSIPAQREANQRKAHELGAQVVAEFVDAGESARSADRPELQRLLGYIATHQVTYCIVHKIDRLARSRIDDVEIHRALVSAGVTLVSATENIDETPSGMLLHGIMSTIAEFYSRNLAAEVVKGMGQKVAQGGTPTRAPIGYLNVQRRDQQGRQIRTVEIDPERAPHIRFAFHAYATGDVSVVELLRILTARGLTSVPSPSRPAQPIGRSTLYKLLTNPYYVGRVRYRGAEHPGSHEPLVPAETWHKVQTLLAARGADSTRHVIHDHYLKGTLYCGTCRSRMLLDFATNRQGTTYAYFICAGRAQKRTDCKRRAVPVGVAEELVEDCYAQVRINEDTYRQLTERIGRAFDERAATRSEELADLTRNRSRLEAESEKLLAAHFADAIDLPTLKKHQDRIRIGIADTDAWLATHQEEYATTRAHLDRALRLLADCHRLYRDSPPELRRMANQAFVERVYITEDEQIETTLAQPFSELAEVGSSRKEPSVRLTEAGAQKYEQALRAAELLLAGNLPAPVADPDYEPTRRVRQPQHRPTSEETREIGEEYQAGMTMREIAQARKLNRETVSRALRRANVPIRRVELGPAQLSEAAALHAEGWSLNRLGRKFGVDPKTMKRRLADRTAAG